ncbi:MAG: spermidine/putrescine ABC transporter substrate-binding protein [Trueperaceae bacterium]|nr:spermidine/putrescine ABC transporter substrate-binding protein [Trueperaceae bacterium]MCC6309618.1 spermidine/putrescine ABC transporter substrate-binding protein [Trueperaceae bacterium]MCO5173348.1 spermidine/putrescine ABC transporter substrate-binding protein [Trueperaceae bacterium]MCW5818361.1 spermidine/putrescine ABC transporter substrate-binding protein [Trueperaceae bacterium]
MRRTIAACLVAVVVSAAAAQTDWTCPDGFAGQTLSVYNWATYVADDTISNFEAACGVRVIYDTYGSDEDMVVRLRQGNPGYDIVVPTNANVPTMIREGLLEKIDHGKLTNLGNLDATFMNLPFDPGNEYTVPYQWGTVGIGYNVDKVGEIASWADMFAYDGPVAWLQDTTAMLGMGLLMVGKDPNSESAADIDEAAQFLIDNGRNVIYIAQDDGQEILARGEADIVVEYSGDIFQVMDECGCDTYAYVIPEEGTNFWVDSLAIPKGAPNKALAEAFIDYILWPQVGADISNYTAFGTPNLAALDDGLIDEELAEDPAIYPSDETKARLFFAEQSEAREPLLNDAWDMVKIFVGR